MLGVVDRRKELKNWKFEPGDLIKREIEDFRVGLILRRIKKGELINFNGVVTPEPALVDYYYIKWCSKIGIRIQSWYYVKEGVEPYFEKVGE